MPTHPDNWAELLYEKLERVNPGIEEMEPYEFRYALRELTPESGDWAGIVPDDPQEIETRVNSVEFYRSIQIKPRDGDRIVLDPAIVRLARMLFAGLVSGRYTPEWVMTHFSFDVRGFYFLHRIVYFTAPVLAHLGGAPLCRFEPRQKQFDRCQSLGYKAFKEANAEIDGAFMDAVRRLIEIRGTPIILAIAGQTAAGKTEIVERLRSSFESAGRSVTSIEMDNFLTDRDYREEKGIYTLGKQAIHLELLRNGLAELCRGRTIHIPRYDTLFATSSHDLDGRLKPGCTPVVVEPAEIIFIEGNFPFLLEEIAPLIGIKVVYLTDDAIRMKRKWRRDIDYRKKYEPTYFRNRFFKEQFLMAQTCYLPQLQLCDLAVDTTGAALWATPAVARALGSYRPAGSD